MNLSNFSEVDAGNGSAERARCGLTTPMNRATWRTLRAANRLRRISISCLAACLVLALAGPAIGQSTGAASTGVSGASAAWPTRPIRIVVPFPAGGSGDVLARLLASSMAVGLGQAVLVENRPGGGMVIAAEAVLRPPVDGHTVLLTAASFTMGPLLRARLSYDPLRDFLPVTQLVSSPLVLVVREPGGARSAQALIEQARSTPGRLMLGALGPGATQHVAAEMFKAAARVDMTYVPYAGGAPAVNALLGGHVDAVIANYSEVGQQVDAGRLRAVAVMTPERLTMLAETPTMTELGLASVNATVWFGFNLPAGSSNQAVQRLHDEAVRALRLPDVAARLAAIGMVPVASSPAAFERHLRTETDQYARIIASAGIKVE